MLYELVKIKDKEYKCRLNASACIDAEKRLGTNPLNIFIEAADGNLPSLNSMLTVFHASLQAYNPGLTMADACAIYDEYCDEGGNLMSFIQVLMKIFETAGFIPKDESKN